MGFKNYEAFVQLIFTVAHHQRVSVCDASLVH